MNIQIFGTKKCKETKKAERFFKERKIQFQFVNLQEKELSRGEFKSVMQSVGGADKMLDTEGKEFEKRNLAYMVYDTEDEIFRNQALLRTPIVRNGKKATIGNAPDVWKDWLKG